MRTATGAGPQLAVKLNKRATSRRFAGEPCTCVVLTPVEQRMQGVQAMEQWEGKNTTVPIAQELYAAMSTMIQSLFTHGETFSILLLHMSQLEASSLTTHYERRHYHASPDLLQQVLRNVRRVLRIDDKMFINGPGGAAIIFSQVDREGIRIIVERVYRSVSLLQAQTMTPPLTHETTIVFGYGTYPQPSASLDALYQQIEYCAYTVTFRPALVAHRRGVRSVPVLVSERQPDHKQPVGNASLTGAVPYLELPHVLPKRVKALLPYQIACEFHCAPVGYERQQLTVAMREPTNATMLTRLHEITGLTIFPVACEEQELNALLIHPW
ncbi:hypothetical protein KDI_00180 [Dictyobacter arantiisoli]|uniref:Type II secretion system protein GspE N-terminal domain-containing protein n=1 Tax=Dictyobacter arantiisoli TaxID=2014874 RepID=A0A5A5T626_9CHLR|nr:hypothetical protein KDI_00180 [Dictyobacter arantiisoli]